MSESMSNRDRRGRLVEQALDLGLSAEIKAGVLILRGAGWVAPTKDLAQVEDFLRGYACGRADAEAAEGRECSCSERSWYGPVHDTACDFAGQRRALFPSDGLR